MNAIRFKLCVMMFLEFFIWGAWFPLIFGYLPSLGFDADWEQPLILGAFNLAAFAAMFFSTQFADRHFAAERFVALSQLIGGAAILGLAFIQRPELDSSHALIEKPEGGLPSAPFWPFFLLMLVHALFYVPTISITNSIAFANLKDPQKEFGPVRMWGTIGWIAAAWPFVFILVDWAKVPNPGSLPFFEWLGKALGTAKEGAAFRQACSNSFIVAGVASIVMAGFSLSLPHTPPRRAEEGAERFAWLEAMKLLRLPFVLVLFIVTFFDSAVHQCYFFWTERYLTGGGTAGVGIASNWVMPVMSAGQIAEIGTMAFLGYCLKALGWRYTMVIGILGHVVRFTVFAFAPYPVVAILAILLHGICYAFFFATVYIFVDEYFPKDARSSAQGLFNFLILGLGPFLGNFAWGRLGSIFQTSKDTYDFRSLFLVPAAVGLMAALILFVFFRPPQKAVAEIPSFPEEIPETV